MRVSARGILAKKTRLFLSEEIEEPVSPPPMSIKLKVHSDRDEEKNGEENSKSIESTAKGWPNPARWPFISKISQQVFRASPEGRIFRDANPMRQI